VKSIEAKELPPDPAEAWLYVQVGRHCTAVLRVIGSIDTERAEDLWDAIEYALEAKSGRRVIVDLTEVSGFDAPSVQELSSFTRTAIRRRDDLRLVIDPESAFGQYLSSREPTHKWAVYKTLSEAFE
jgi:ABC-type transporter Mla MlaB component